ncbi:MAG: DUF402 domain-containing protein [Corynebacterium sp.]|nr:DUF402 domain-containing protein [Corynebacterium sp.]
MNALHPVKEEKFDLSKSVNKDPKGFLRDVDVFRVTDFGLYMARGADHPKFGYVESWLLPELGLRANVYHYRNDADSGVGDGGKEQFYIDVADISVDGDIWSTRDLYVDLLANDGVPVEVLDIDELAAATSAGLITAEEAERAIENTLAAVEGITRHRDSLLDWLAANGYTLDWADPESITLTPAQASTTN